MTLVMGTKCGPYEIVGAMGAGGMGEVYRARDTKLGREVALKVLPEAFASDAERLARFEREAKVLASLNHTNIAAIYGFEDSSGVPALVMELVEGPTLAERISGPVGTGLKPAPTRARAIPIDEALPIAKQICEGLEYAHERGIVHRDLKPANVKITPDGVVKILDFGLAKALAGETAAADPSTSPTLSHLATQAGIILGTAAYMAPEQAKGKPVDRRADIWAFGCVLYEMLTGKPAFSGETVTDILAAVVTKEPDWSALPAATPTHVRVLLQRCLRRDAKQRLRDIGDARIALDEVISGAAKEIAPPAAGAAMWRRVWPWVIVGAAVAVAVVTGALWKFAGPALRQPEMHFSAVTNFAGVQAQPAISPDGRSIAFVSNRDGNYNVYVGLIHGGNLIQITHDPNLESAPRWSPDGAALAYARLDRWGLWDIWEVPALGGTPRRVILNAMDPAWSPDGRSLAYVNMTDGAIGIAGVSGESARQAVALMPLLGDVLSTSDAQPCFSPDGRQLAFVVRGAGPYGELDVADLGSGKVRQLTHDGALAMSPAWSPDGRFIYFASSRGGTMNIWKIAAGGGEPEQITSGQGDDAQLDVSADGKRIVFSTWRAGEGIAQLDLGGKGGKQNLVLLTTDPARNQLAPAYSPNGKYLAYFTNLKGAENEGIWISNADGSNPLELVQDAWINVFPRWTPDGRNLIFWSDKYPLDVAPEYRIVPISGGAPKTFFRTGSKTGVPTVCDVGPGGRVIFLDQGNRVKDFDPRTGKTATLATLPAGLEFAPPLRWSPDGRSIALIVHASRDGDPNAGLWVDDFKSPAREIFHGWVVWFARGPRDEIYLLQGKPDLNGALWKVNGNGQGLVQLGDTIPLVQSYWIDQGVNDQDYFAVSPDGKRLAFDQQAVLSANIGMIEDVRSYSAQ